MVLVSVPGIGAFCTGTVCKNADNKTPLIIRMNDFIDCTTGFLMRISLMVIMANSANISVEQCSLAQKVNIMRKKKESEQR